MELMRSACGRKLPPGALDDTENALMNYRPSVKSLILIGAIVVAGLFIAVRHIPVSASTVQAKAEEVDFDDPIFDHFVYLPLISALPSFDLPAEDMITETYDLYAPYRERREAIFVDLTTRAPAGQWLTEPTGPGQTDVSWGVPDHWEDRSVEEHAIKTNCAGGRSWVWLTAYRSPKYAQRYEIETMRAVLRIGSATWDITSGGQCGTVGQPYALYHIFPIAYEMQVWGKIYSADRTSFRRFFWQHRITPNQVSDNPCWTGDTLFAHPALRQDELWWDEDNGFSIGTGNLGSDGVPDGTGTVYGRYQYIAKDVGFVWRIGQSLPASSAWEGCLRETWVP